MANKTIYIIASTFYPELSNELIKGAKKELDDDISVIIKVPGAFEIPGMAKQIIDNYSPDLIITLGVLIKGETNHFEYISESISNSISQLTITSKIPIIFGVITALNYEQASERALISKKNKGAELMKAGLEMLVLYDKHKK